MMKRNFWFASVGLMLVACAPSSQKNKDGKVQGVFQGAMIAKTGILIYIPEGSPFPVQLAAINSCAGDCGSKLANLVKYYDSMTDDVCGFVISAEGLIKEYNKKQFFVPTQIQKFTGHPIGQTPHLQSLDRQNIPCELN
jgi:hypothetical protein